MEGREEPDSGYDDWFDEPEPPTAETQSGAGRAAYDGEDEVWGVEEEPLHSGGHREFVIAGRTLTATQLAIVAVSIVALILAILAAAGAFSSSKQATPPVVTPPPAPKTSATTTTATTNTTPTTQAPNTTLSPGDTGEEVKNLQRSLTSLGYTVTVDGDYGPATQVAVEKFQVANGLAEDGVVGPETLAKLQQKLSG